MKTIREARNEVGGFTNNRYICGGCYDHNLMIPMQEKEGNLICPVCKAKILSPENKDN